MSSSPAIPRPDPAARLLRPTWSYDLLRPCHGLALAREKKWLLAWDEQPWLYLLNQVGALQSQRRFPFALTAACAADDGSAYVVAGEHGEVHWLAPDLMPRWERVLPYRPIAAALDSLGQYLVVSAQHGEVHCYDRLGRSVAHFVSPRPLFHLAFVSDAPLVVGCSDFGFAGCFELSGLWHWRHGPVSHMGALAVGGQQAVTACFTQGLQFFGINGRRLAPHPVTWPCRHVALSFDGQLALISWLDRRLHLLGPEGQDLVTIPVNDNVAALAFHALGEAAVVGLAGGQILSVSLKPTV